MDTNIPLIEFSNVDINNGDSLVIADLNFTLCKGDFVYLTGRVGSGKTSIFRAITAEHKLLKGAGQVCGYDLTKIRAKDIPYLRRKIGVVFQDFQLLMDRSVEENLLFVLKATGWKDASAIRKRIDEVLEAVGMTTKAHKMPHQLSGGEQQRIAIARAILNNPALILADEPTGNLDEETAEGILQLLQQINREQGTAIVMVTHNRSICTRYPGRVFETRDEACKEITL
jgi:cell division transport system ATP-binding protein